MTRIRAFLADLLAVKPIYRHAARTTLGAILALWVAYSLELDTPYSAATTVLIVAHPVHGMILSKSLYRLGGSILGAIIAVTLTALFAQSPQMFLLGLGLWMAVCTFASTILRSFRSYGAVLAGYTVVLITMPSIDHPELIFNLAVNRVVVVGLGILCSALVASLTTTRNAERTLEKGLANVVAEIARYARQAITGAEAQTLVEPRRTLARKIAELDALVEFAALETSVGMSNLSDALRGGATALFGALTAATAAHEALARLPDRTLLDGLDDEFAALLEETAATMAPGVEIAPIEERLINLAARLESRFGIGGMPVLAVLDRLREVCDELILALDGLAAVSGSRPARQPVRPSRHRDVNWALINAARAAVTVWVAGAVWFYTAWPIGSNLIAMIVPNVSLLSLRDRPSTDAVMFTFGTCVASALGLFYLCWVLPQITGFALLVLVLAPVLFLSVVVSMNPKTAFVGVGFYVFFITMLAPTNPMVYDPELFLNMALSTVVGSILTAVVHRVFLPIDPRRHVRALVRAIQGDLHTLISRQGLNIPALWETRMHERLIQLGGRIRAAGVAQDHLMRGGFAALRIGREILRLRSFVQTDPIAAQTVQPVVRALNRLSSSPQECVAACREASRHLLTIAPERDDGRPLFRAAAALSEIAILIGRHRLFFKVMPRG